ncbi:HNH endonuclease signature motif containing protein, partial [Cellulomonas fengjieae]|uniref:HNH endonuclease signature motif containing protein n=1 Tax=Cellulomonas fengjieae TaxID=2819978 RepID=UPI001AAF0168
RRVAERERRGVFLDLAPDAMARLIAYLPAAEATAAFTVIDALAGHGAPDGDPRTIDQRRADAFADVFTTILDRQATLDGTPLPSRHGQRAALQVSVAATTLLGLDDHPATLGSYGPIPAQVARELAQDATWRRVLTDPAGQVCAVGTTAYRPGADLTRTVIARDVTCTFPGCRQPATRCELDHRIPYDHARTTAPRTTGTAAVSGAVNGAPSGHHHHADPPAADPQTCLENLHALCKHHHQAKTTGWWQVTWDKDTGISTWTDRHGLTYARHPIPVHTT